MVLGKIKNYRIYSILQKINALRIAVLRIKIDCSSIREFYAFLCGYARLSKGNYFFYKNFCSKILCKGKFAIIDVGANDGWFVKSIFRFSKDENIEKLVSFEPLRSQQKKLETLKSQFKNYYYECMAMGEKEGNCIINEYETTGLSSLRSFHPNYSYNSNYYNTDLLTSYEVKVSTIEQYIEKNEFACPIILKVDTQGYEMNVLQGASKYLANGKIYAVIIELMTIEKYKNAALYNEIISFLDNLNFGVFDMYLAGYEPDGRLSEFDVIFIKRGNSND
jgi:FkbM family methyltransferase